MTYNIDWKSNNAESIPGKAPIILAERTVNTTSTSLALTGKGTANYGEMQQENFIRLLENFASNTAPANPTIGQLWFHPVDKALYLCVQTSTVVANTAVYYQSGVIGWVRVWESTELGTIVGVLEQAIVDAIAAHVNAADPHPQYLTQTEGNLQYLQKTGGTLTGPLVLPSDASTALQAVPKQQLDAALTTHTNAADPHPQYLTQTEADGRYSLGSGTVNLTGNQTVAGTKTFSSTISGSVSGNAGTVTNGVYTADDQTISGVKTFTSSPIVPTPLSSDNSQKVATTEFARAVGLGYGQTWQNLKNSRTHDTVYVNNTGKPICVFIEASNISVGTEYIRNASSFNVDGLSFTLALSVRLGGTEYSISHISIVIPPGSNYELAVTNQPVHISEWRELR